MSKKSWSEQAREQYNRLRRGEEGREEEGQLNRLLLDQLQKPAINIEDVDVLLEQGADPYYKEKGQNSAFDHAMSSGDLEIMHAMYQARPNPAHKIILNEVTVARIAELTKQDDIEEINHLVSYADRSGLEAVRKAAEDMMLQQGMSIIGNEISEEERAEMSNHYRQKHHVLLYEDLVPIVGRNSAGKLINARTIEIVDDEKSLDYETKELFYKDNPGVLIKSDAQQGMQGLNIPEDNRLNILKKEELERGIDLSANESVRNAFYEFLKKGPLLGVKGGSGLYDRAVSMALNNFDNHPEMLSLVVNLVKEQNSHNPSVVKELAQTIAEYANKQGSIQIALELNNVLHLFDEKVEGHKLSNLSDKSMNALGEIKRITQGDNKKGLLEKDLIKLHNAVQLLKQDWDKLPSDLGGRITQDVINITGQYLNECKKDNNFVVMANIAQVASQNREFMAHKEYVDSSDIVSRHMSLDGKSKLTAEELDSFIKFIDNKPYLGPSSGEGSLAIKVRDIALQHVETHPELLEKISELVVEQQKAREKPVKIDPVWKDIKALVGPRNQERLNGLLKQNDGIALSEFIIEKKLVQKVAGLIREKHPEIKVDINQNNLGYAVDYVLDTSVQDKVLSFVAMNHPNEMEGIKDNKQLADRILKNKNFLRLMNKGVMDQVARIIGTAYPEPVTASNLEASLDYLEIQADENPITRVENFVGMKVSKDKEKLQEFENIFQEKPVKRDDDTHEEYINKIKIWRKEELERLANFIDKNGLSKDVAEFVKLAHQDKDNVIINNMDKDKYSVCLALIHIDKDDVRGNLVADLEERINEKVRLIGEKKAKYSDSLGAMYKAAKRLNPEIKFSDEIFKVLQASKDEEIIQDITNNALSGFVADLIEMEEKAQPGKKEILNEKHNKPELDQEKETLLDKKRQLDQEQSRLDKNKGDFNNKSAGKRSLDGKQTQLDADKVKLDTKDRLDAEQEQLEIMRGQLLELEKIGSIEAVTIRENLYQREEQLDKERERLGEVSFTQRDLEDRQRILDGDRKQLDSLTKEKLDDRQERLNADYQELAAKTKILDDKYHDLEEEHKDLDNYLEIEVNKLTAYKYIKEGRQFLLERIRDEVKQNGMIDKEFEKSLHKLIRTYSAELNKDIGMMIMNHAVNPEWIDKLPKDIAQKLASSLSASPEEVDELSTGKTGKGEAKEHTVHFQNNSVSFLTKLIEESANEKDVKTGKQLREKISEHVFGEKDHLGTSKKKFFGMGDKDPFDYYMEYKNTYNEEGMKATVKRLVRRVLAAARGLTVDQYEAKKLIKRVGEVAETTKGQLDPNKSKGEVDGKAMSYNIRNQALQESFEAVVIPTEEDTPERPRASAADIAAVTRKNAAISAVTGVGVQSPPGKKGKNTGVGVRVGS